MQNDVYNVTFENGEGNVWCLEVRAESKYDALAAAKKEMEKLVLDKDKLNSFLPIDVKKGNIDTLTIEGE